MDDGARADVLAAMPRRDLVRLVIGSDELPHAVGAGESDDDAARGRAGLRTLHRRRRADRARRERRYWYA